MNRILRNVSLVCFLALAGASQAISLTDDFALGQTGVILTQPGTATSAGTSLGGGLTRFLVNTQNSNTLPSIAQSSVAVSGGAFTFNNDPGVQSNYAIDYRYSTAVDFTGIAGFQVDFRTNDLPYDLYVDLTDGSGRVSTFAGFVRAGSAFTVFASGLTGSADLANIVRVSFQSDQTQPGTDSSIVGIRSFQSTPSVPGPMAALPFALMALKRRKSAKG